jgi:hypothetical protein
MAVVGALGLDPAAPRDQLDAAVRDASIDDLAKLKAADADFAVRMKQLDVDLEKVDADDRSNARSREIAVHDHTPEVLAYLLTLGFFGLLAMMCVHDLPAANAQLLYVLLGSLGTGWIGAMTYFFGSSAGSRAKSQMLFNSTPTAALSPPAPLLALPAPIPLPLAAGRSESPS